MQLLVSNTLNVGGDSQVEITEYRLVPANILRQKLDREFSGRHKDTPTQHNKIEIKQVTECRNSMEALKRCVNKQQKFYLYHKKSSYDKHTRHQDFLPLGLRPALPHSNCSLLSTAHLQQFPCEVPASRCVLHIILVLGCSLILYTTPLIWVTTLQGLFNEG